MKLTQDQIEEFDREGFLFLPECFSREEVKVLTDELPGIFAQRREEVWREKDGEAVRTAFAAHTYNEAFRRLDAHPRLIERPLVETDKGVRLCRPQERVAEIL